MSAGTASSTDAVVVHVRLTNEAVDVWRPVAAYRLSGNVYELSSEPAPEDEAWAFGPGESVVVEQRPSSRGRRAELVAVARASDLDTLSAGYARRTA